MINGIVIPVEIVPTLILYNKFPLSFSVEISPALVIDYFFLAEQNMK